MTASKAASSRPDLVLGAISQRLRQGGTAGVPDKPIGYTGRIR